jgi:hypothetical protein
MKLKTHHCEILYDEHGEAYLIRQSGLEVPPGHKRKPILILNLVDDDGTPPWKVPLGSKVTITCKGKTVTGIVTYSDNDTIVVPTNKKWIAYGYDLEIRDENNLPYRWKSYIEGGEIEIHEEG